MKTIMVALFVSLFGSSLQAKSFYVLNPKVEQGEVLVIRIEPQWQGSNVGIFIFNKTYFPNKYGEVFIGIELDQEPGTYQVYRTEFGLRGGDWYYDEVMVLEKNLGNPWFRRLPKRNSKISAQREEEQRIKNDAYASANIREDYTDGAFINPLDNIQVNDNFGTPRIYGKFNSKTKKWTPIPGISPVYHGGVDLKAKIGTSVKAINSGSVLLAHNFPISGTEGKMIIIDHGSGILSFYLHLSKFKVTTGDWVKKGEIIALSGATPRGTPQHLHWMVRVNGINVDPVRFIQTINEYFK